MRQICCQCPNSLGHAICAGCQKWMCAKHFIEHRKKLSSDMGNLSDDYDHLQRDLMTDSFDQHSLLMSIDAWEKKSIETIRRAAHEARNHLKKHHHRTKFQVQKSLNQIVEELKRQQQNDDYTEIELNEWTQQLQNLRHQLEDCSIVQFIDDQKQDSNSSKLILSLEASENVLVPREFYEMKWRQHGSTVAGGRLQDTNLDQLNCPYSFDIDDRGRMFIADYSNNRVFVWNRDSMIAEILPDGDENNRLSGPTALIIDRKTNSLIISDSEHRRIVKWSLNDETKGEVIITDVLSYGLAMDRDHALYVSDWERHEVRRFEPDEFVIGTVVAGGHGPGDRFDQLKYPENIFVDEDYSIYVSDSDNHRVMKWTMDSKEGIIVAGNQSEGDSLRQVSSPRGLFVDAQKSVFIVEYGNHRVTRWLNGAKEGYIIVGGHGPGAADDQLHHPSSLVFDRHGDLYVCDCYNNRIQYFPIG